LNRFSKSFFALLNAHKIKVSDLDENLPNVNKNKAPRKKEGEKKDTRRWKDSLMSPDSNVHYISNFGSFCWEGD
jgi:hypothetical protein